MCDKCEICDKPWSLDEYKTEYCPRHEAAVKMLNVCIAIKKWWNSLETVFHGGLVDPSVLPITRIRTMLNEAIAEAKGVNDE